MWVLDHIQRIYPKTDSVLDLIQRIYLKTDSVSDLIQHIHPKTESVSDLVQRIHQKTDSVSDFIQRIHPKTRSVNRSILEGGLLAPGDFDGFAGGEGKGDGATNNGAGGKAAAALDAEHFGTLG